MLLWNFVEGYSKSWYVNIWIERYRYIDIEIYGGKCHHLMIGKSFKFLPKRKTSRKTYNPTETCTFKIEGVSNQGRPTFP